MKVIWLNNKWKMEDAVLTATHLLICISKDGHECGWQLPGLPRYKYTNLEKRQIQLSSKSLLHASYAEDSFLKQVHDGAVQS